MISKPIPFHARLRLQRVLVLGIAGPSGSGKTTLARELAQRLPATLLPLDAYYRSLDHLPPATRAEQNFDHPDALEWQLLVDQVATLARGHAIDQPCYDFVTHTRVPDRTQRIEPEACLIVEGILALRYTGLRALLNFAVYVQAPASVCLARRTERDIRERGRSEHAIREQFRSTTQPMAEQFVHPSAAHADLVLSGTEPLQNLVNEVLAQLRARALLP